MDFDIVDLCRHKEQQLLDKYFGDLPREAAVERPETVGLYTRDLPFTVEAEYREFLEDLWRGYSDTPLVLEEQRLRRLMTERDSEALDQAFEDAQDITLWERITRSNHEDVTYYKGLLLEFTRQSLMIMRLDFLEEVTGNHIRGKAFDDQDQA